MNSNNKSTSHARGGEHEKLISLNVEKATPFVAKNAATSVLFLLDVPHACSCSCHPLLNRVALTALKNLAYASIWIALSASVILFNK